ncbi:MAG: WXG100 family type VII secretion target [Actinomycetes bacterium]
MSGEMSKQDQALTRGAQLVSEARSELDQQMSALRGKLAGVGAQWVGAGSAAFQQVMTRWDEDTRRIVTALNDFETNLRSSEATYTSSDDQQAQAFSRFQGALGG